MRHHKFIFKCLIIVILSLTGCASSHSPATKCTLIFEDNASLYFPNQIYELNPLEDLTISIGVPHGYRISSVNYADYSLSSKTGETLSYDYYTLVLNHIRYSSVIRIEVAPSYTTTYYSSIGTELNTVQEASPHLRFNTLAYHSQYDTEGYLPIGWNTAANGDGIQIGFGSRVDHSNTQNLYLYLEQLADSPAEHFSYRITEREEAAITGYHGTGNIIIPASIEGYPVTTISEHAFSNISVDIMAFPASIHTIESHAFGNTVVEDFYFFDNIVSFPENAFESYQITTLHVNAYLDPVYSGSYFDTLSDKIDYLYTLQHQQKLILFCGSSARFGYDSSQLEAAFPDYKVVNMGVYAYSNMLPQAKILLEYLTEGDIILSSPELDAIDTQFCGTNDFDKETFCMAESNYDMLTLLNSREFTNIFASFTEYNNSRSQMSARSYLESPSYYDEDGNPVSSPSYNSFGDYIVFRENNETGKNFGIKRAYYNSSYFRQQDIDGINSVYSSFQEKGATVFFAYSPRSSHSISDDSTVEEVIALDTFLQENLNVPIISSIQDSLMDPFYFCGTDNHLSTEGVALHTKDIILVLRSALEAQP